MFQMVGVFPSCLLFLERIMDKCKFVQVGDHVQLRVPKPSGLLKDGDIGLVVSWLQRTWMELQDHRKNHRHGMNMYLMGCHRKNSIPFDHNDNFDGSCNAYILSTGTSLAFFQKHAAVYFQWDWKAALEPGC